MADQGGVNVKLHWLDGSRAQAIQWLLEELQVPYELDIYHRGPNLMAPPELEKIHPLGKSPAVTITPPGGGQPVVLAESGFIIQYLCDHFGQGKTLVPRRWKDGQEGKVGGETEEWMRYQYTLYYSEGSLMPNLLTYMLFSGLKGPSIPWFIRPITRAIADRVIAGFIFPNIKRHLSFLDSQLATSPGGGSYLCGTHLTAADILIAYPLLAAGERFEGIGAWEKGSARKTFPNVFAYMDRLQVEPGWKRAAKKIEEIEGKFYVAP